MKNKRLLVIVAAVAGLLLIPFTAMQFTPEMDWDLADFVIMGTLLLVTGLLIDLVMRKVKGFGGRLLIVVVIFILFLLVWAELGVGIFGTPFAGS